MKFFIKSLQLESWADIYQASVEFKYDAFLRIFSYYFNLAFSKTKTRVSNRKDSWITYDLKKDKEEIISLSQTIRLSQDKVLRQFLKEKQKNYTCKINTAKKEFIENKIKNSDNICKSTWKIINSEIKNSPKPDRDLELIINDTIYNDPHHICEIFNDYFVNAIDNLTSTNLLPNSSPNLNKMFLPNKLTGKFRLSPVTEEELDKVISSFKNKYSVGFDDIPVPVIKKSKKYLIRPLLHVINSSFISGIFPDKLKVAKIRSVFKKGSESDPSNYRPLSILPTFSKIFERVMYSRLVDFLNKNGLFDDEQHGYRVSKSVITAGIDLVDTIVDAIDRGDNVIGIFMDLSKAFDSVCHSKLVNILRNLGIEGVPLQWFKSYLSDRMQYVELPQLTKQNQLVHFKSSLKMIKHGVPQGSILGPILFLCYLQGLPETLIDNNAKLCLYADDSNLIISGKTINDIENIAKNNLSAIKTYFNEKISYLIQIKQTLLHFTPNKKET